jgi:hypothetical protein
VERYGATVSFSIVSIEVLQPGPRAELLLKAIAAALKADLIVANRPGVQELVASMPYPVARDRVRRAIARAGDPDGEIIRIA